MAMFTGIIETTATVLSNTNGLLSLERPATFDDLKIGASIAVSGVCLTIVRLDGTSMDFVMVPETLEKSTLGHLEEGDIVNLERAMPADGRLDGHIVQGHIEGTGRVQSVEISGKSKSPNTKNDQGLTIGIALSDELAANVIHKGSITVDGVSLTVAFIEQNLCTIAVIPHTAEHTTLGALKKRDRVNIETDVLVRYARMTKHQ